MKTLRLIWKVLVDLWKEPSILLEKTQPPLRRDGVMRARIIVDVELEPETDLLAFSDRLEDFFMSDDYNQFPEIAVVDDFEVKDISDE